MIDIESQRLVYRHDGETLWIEPWGADALRVRATRGAEMPADAWALLEPPPCAVEIETSAQGGTIRNGKLTARVNSAGKLVFSNAQGRVLLEEYVRQRRRAKGEPEHLLSALNIEAREFKPILGGDYSLTLRFESNPEERLYGMGQYQQPFLNLKGCELELAQRNSQASVPFVLSSLGYGFLWNNPAIGRVSFARNLTTWEAPSTQGLDYWICAGDTPAEIEQAYARATGTVPMMPEFAMGFWQCKLRYRTQEELLSVAREYHRRGLPISVIVVDFFHWPMQGEWTFDPEYWPDPKGMVEELREMGIELMVSVWPTVDKRSRYYGEMLERGYLVRTDRGVRTESEFLGNCVFYDATHPGARKYVWERIKANYGAHGIRLFWLDEAEPEYARYDFDLYRYHLGPNLQVGNIYPRLYSQGFYDGLTGAGWENPIHLVRCAWAGSQRYGALVWSGDIHSSFACLRSQVAAGLNMGIAGIPWWTTDIGGFHGGNPDDPAFRELFVRWFQYGAFCPVMRLHGDRDPHSPPLGTAGGGVCGSGAANEVWSYGEQVYEICVRYMNLREKLKPYIAALMKEAHERGTPVIRPLFYDFPEDPAAWAVEDQFLFGPDLLVAPVLEAGARRRAVRLPAGADWRDAWTGETCAGGQVRDVEAPLARIPLFVRDGAALLPTDALPGMPGARTSDRSDKSDPSD